MSSTALEVRPQSVARSFMDDVAALALEFSSGPMLYEERLETIHRDNMIDIAANGKRCSGPCRQHKPLNAFGTDYVRGFLKEGKHIYCKDCRKAQRLARMKR